jgi:hypothetical protein
MLKEGGFADPPSIMLPLPLQEADVSNSNTATFSRQLPSLLQHDFEQLHFQSAVVVDVIKERGDESVPVKNCLAGLFRQDAMPSPSAGRLDRLACSNPVYSLWLKDCLSGSS